MSKVTHYPKSADQPFGLSTLIPDTYDPSKKYMLWLMGHGIGECNDGSLAGIRNTFNWSNWKPLHDAVDKYDFIEVHVNTDDGVFYKNKEYQFCLDWALKNLSVNENNICVLGHSLGSFGAGRYAFTDSNFAKKINIWFASAAGPYSRKGGAGLLDQDESIKSNLFKNLTDLKVKVWGITAQNDKEVGTDPIYIMQLYPEMRKLDADAIVIVSEFPESRWPTPAGKKGSAAAHNIVLSELAKDKISIPQGITLGVPDATLQMNVFQWAISNPKGSIYQAPTEKFVGPKTLEEPQLQPIPAPPSQKPTIIGMGSAGPVEVVWSDGTKTFHKAPAGDKLWAYLSLKTKTITLDHYGKSPKEVIGPFKK